ncbi:MAG: hypothetical protein V2I67_08690 [Thermoanaerobaculales bacterium]|nr:hypothetical protein [Thermoanaerobaculales bacterium]
MSTFDDPDEDRTRQGIRSARAALADPGRFEKLTAWHGDTARWVLDAWTAVWLSPEFAGWSLDEHLGNVCCPVLAIHGDQDEYGSLEFPRRIVGGARRDGDPRRSGARAPSRASGRRPRADDPVPRLSVAAGAGSCNDRWPLPLPLPLPRSSVIGLGYGRLPVRRTAMWTAELQLGIESWWGSRALSRSEAYPQPGGFCRGRLCSGRHLCLPSEAPRSSERKGVVTRYAGLLGCGRLDGGGNPASPDQRGHV